MLKVVMINPLKHHSYYSMHGLVMVEPSAIAYFGFYNKSDFSDNFLSKSPYAKLAEGYTLRSIDNHVKVNKFMKMLFLAYKKNH